mgnify:CR=1 FL=1
MANEVEAKLAALGLTLPQPAAPAANYVPWTLANGIVYVAGQLPFKDGKLVVTGKLGDTVSLEEGQEAARWCAMNILAHVRNACGGDLGRVKSCLRLGGFVACLPTFTQHPAVVNGASDLMVAALGDAGRHARFAVGVAVLPFDAAVEIDATFEIR